MENFYTNQNYALGHMYSQRCENKNALAAPLCLIDGLESTRNKKSPECTMETAESWYLENWNWTEHVKLVGKM